MDPARVKIKVLVQNHEGALPTEDSDTSKRLQFLGAFSLQEGLKIFCNSGRVLIIKTVNLDIKESQLTYHCIKL